MSWMLSHKMSKQKVDPVDDACCSHEASTAPFESKVPVVVSTCFKLSTRLPECIVQSLGVESWISDRVWAAASFSAVSSSQAHVLLRSVEVTMLRWSLPLCLIRPDAHSTPAHVQVPFSRLLPRADDEAISRRAQEDQLFAVRTLLRHVQQGDRLASHTFVLRHYEDILRQQSSLRDRLPAPTGANVADDDWVKDFIGAVYDVMRANTRTARRQPIRNKARMPEKFSDEYRPALPVPAGCVEHRCISLGKLHGQVKSSIYAPDSDDRGHTRTERHGKRTGRKSVATASYRSEGKRS